MLQELPKKWEKKSERLTVVIEPSLKRALEDLDKQDVDVPEFIRRVLREALQGVKPNSAA